MAINVLIQKKRFMKKLFIYSFFIFISSSGIAQKDTVKLKDIQRNEMNVVTDRAPQAVYFLLGGSGPFLSAHYDRRFAKKVNGAGFSAGLGFFGVSGFTVVSIPISINYLIGRNTHFFEVAAGTTFVTGTTDLFNSSNSQSGSGFVHHINLGYRHQPTRGGFFFRGGISPLFVENEYITSYYLGFGRNF